MKIIKITQNHTTYEKLTEQVYIQRPVTHLVLTSPSRCWSQQRHLQPNQYTSSITKRRFDSEGLKKHFDIFLHEKSRNFTSFITTSLTSR